MATGSFPGFYRGNSADELDKKIKGIAPSQGQGTSFPIGEGASGYESLVEQGIRSSLPLGGHHPAAKAFLDAFTGRGINLSDSTGSAFVYPGMMSINPSSPDGVRATINAIDHSVSLGKGPFTLSGGFGNEGQGQSPWVQLGYQSGMGNQYATRPIDSGRAASQAVDAALGSGSPEVNQPSAGRQAFEQQFEAYKQANPEDWWRSPYASQAKY